MKKKALAGVLFVASLAIAACGGDDSTQTAAPAEPLAVEAPAGATVAVKAFDTLLGTVLTGPDEGDGRSVVDDPVDRVNRR
jgi:hypothetical protein